MDIIPVVDEGLGHSAYLVDLGDGGALVDEPDTVPGGAVLLDCGRGERAMSAASLLERAGHRELAVLVGGPGDLGPLEVET